MFGWLNNIRERIRKLNINVNEYQKDTIIQSLPSLAYVNKAKKLIDKGNLKEAEEQLKKALEFPVEDALAYKYLGIIYDKSLRFFDAVEMYQKSADIAPQDKNIWQKLGFALINIQEYDRAEKAFDNANKISPANSDTFTGWGMALMKNKKYEEAREKFVEASKYNRYNFMAIFMSAVAEVKLEMFESASAKLKFLINLNPNEGNLYEYAHLRYLKNDYKEAIYYAEKSLEYNSNMLPSYLLIGKVYALQFDEKAFEYFLKAEEKGLISANLYLEWGKALLRLSKYQVSKHYLLKAIDMEPENVEIIESLALCNVLLDDMADAPPLIEKLREKNAKSKILARIEGIMSYKSGQFKDAFYNLKMNAEEFDENNFLNYYYMAKASENLGDEQRVKDCYENAVLKNPKYTQAYLEYAEFLISKNNFAEAQRKLRKIVKFEPENVEVLNLMFHISYILVKENLCEYNVKETISIAQKISPDLFKYQNELDDLTEIRNSKFEREKS